MSDPVPDNPDRLHRPRKLAQEWAYRFLAAAAAGHAETQIGNDVARDLALAAPVPEREPSPAEIRARARVNGFQIPDRGRVANHIQEAYDRATESP